MSTPARLRFDDLNDLARLPWFDVDHGRLVVSDRSVGPVIDMHSHLALAYVRRMQVDLQRGHAHTEYYLPACTPLDLEPYVNVNFSPRDLKAMKRDLTLMSLTGRGMRATHTVPNLQRDMQDMGIVHSVILPIDLPMISDNAGAALQATRDHSDFVCFGSVHPYSSTPVQRLEEQVSQGARGIKLHPNVQAVRPDDPRSAPLYELCGKLGIPVLWHCGPVGIEPASGRRRSQVALYEQPIREHPETRFVLGHAGALQAELAMELQRRHRNVYLEISSQGVPAIARMVASCDPDRIVYGTDWPFYHQGIALAKVLLVTEGQPALRRKILHDNAARLLGLDAPAPG